jgi:hypothetical protein
MVYDDTERHLITFFIYLLHYLNLVLELLVKTWKKWMLQKNKNGPTNVINVSFPITFGWLFWFYVWLLSVDIVENHFFYLFITLFKFESIKFWQFCLNITQPYQLNSTQFHSFTFKFAISMSFGDENKDIYEGNEIKC